ncbi:MAG: hypothetical protein A2Y24_00860 [Clostridiales bacterium GWE2_32_10]|nr:MAG: hypothetical protein A2Y24_00860 [Clostridiales bacterium GWE2_32_10]
MKKKTSNTGKKTPKTMLERMREAAQNGKMTGLDWYIRHEETQEEKENEWAKLRNVKKLENKDEQIDRGYCLE